VGFFDIAKRNPRKKPRYSEYRGRTNGWDTRYLLPAAAKLVHGRQQVAVRHHPVLGNLPVPQCVTISTKEDHGVEGLQFVPPMTVRDVVTVEGSIGGRVPAPPAPAVVTFFDSLADDLPVRGCQVEVVEVVPKS
jgi:hypothetical protein